MARDRCEATRKTPHKIQKQISLCEDMLCPLSRFPPGENVNLNALFSGQKRKNPVNLHPHSVVPIFPENALIWLLCRKLGMKLERAK